MKKIGIMGGTFDPIHKGHLFLAQEAVNKVNLDMVLFIPTGNSYRKTNVTMAHHRANMTKLAIAGYENFAFSDLELKKQGNTYTFETLIDLKKDYLDAELYFILGADSLFQLDTWMCPELIFQNCTLLVATREDQSFTIQTLLNKVKELEERYQGKIILFSTTNIPVSSTEIRKSVKESKSITTWVPEKVEAYIKDQMLYR